MYSLFGTEPILFGISLQVHHKLLIIVPTAVISWLTVTFLTEPEPIDQLQKFYARAQPGGWWGPVTFNFKHTLNPVSNGFFIQWIAGILMIYGFTFGIGNLIFNNFGNAFFLLGYALIGSYLIWDKSISKLN